LIVAPRALLRPLSILCCPPCGCPPFKRLPSTYAHLTISCTTVRPLLSAHAHHLASASRNNVMHRHRRVSAEASRGWTSRLGECHETLEESMTAARSRDEHEGRSPEARRSKREMSTKRQQQER
jgi:hypothetical protein